MIKKFLAALLCIICVMIAFTACSAKQSDPSEEFAKAKSSVGVVDSVYLSRVKELCKKSLDNEKEVFITASFMDGTQYINAHVLTGNDEYVVYSIDTQMSGPLCEALNTGEAPAGYAYKLESYLQEVEPYVDKETIYFD